jgi:hypothetical protein
MSLEAETRHGNAIMELDIDPNSDLQSLSSATLVEEDEVTVEHDELLGAGSSECAVENYGM